MDKTDAPAKAVKINPLRQIEGYCQFSGGGDICIGATHTQGSLVVSVSQIEGNDDDGGVSPIYPDTFLPNTLLIEGKRTDNPSNKLQHQTWANIMLSSVTKFIEEVKEHFDESDIENVKTITGYGILYTGNGDTAFYKLEMEFGKVTKFITKIQLSERPKPSAAALVDYILGYYIYKKLQQPVNNAQT